MILLLIKTTHDVMKAAARVLQCYRLHVIGQTDANNVLVSLS